MSDVNCLSSDFWDKPLNIDWDDKKFGYCVIAVFGKKKGFERTYMIPWTTRKRTLYPARTRFTNYTLDEIYPKVYNMCNESEANFDSYKAVLCFFNKSLEKWKSKNVYAIYVNPMYRPEDTTANIINYHEQLCGEERALSDDNIRCIIDDLEARYSIHDFAMYYGSSICKCSSIPIPNDVKWHLRHFYFCAGNTKDELVKRHTRQAVCAALGVTVSEWNVPLIEYINQVRRELASRVSSNKYGYKGLATDLLVSNTILNAKCIYQSAIRQVFGEESAANADSLKEMINGYFNRRNSKVKVSFKNFDIMLETLISSIKILSLGIAKEIFFGRTFNMGYRAFLRCGLEYVFDHITANDDIYVYDGIVSKSKIDELVKNDEFYQLALESFAQYIPMFDTFYTYRGGSGVFQYTFNVCRLPICDGENTYLIKFNKLSDYSKEDVVKEFYPI